MTCVEKTGLALQTCAVRWCLLCAGLDVKDAGLPAALHGTAFNRLERTLWVLEGLTYYLSADANQLLLQSMAALSAAGSLVTASMAPQSLVDRIHDRGGTGLMSFWTWGFPPDFTSVRLPSHPRSLHCGGCGRVRRSLWKWAFPANLKDEQSPKLLPTLLSCTAVQVAKTWGWSIVDSVTYVDIAQLYGCEYAPSRRMGGDTATSAFDKLQPPDSAAVDAGGVNLSGDYVRIITAALAPM